MKYILITLTILTIGCSKSGLVPNDVRIDTIESIVHEELDSTTLFSIINEDTVRSYSWIKVSNMTIFNIDSSTQINFIIDSLVSEGVYDPKDPQRLFNMCYSLPLTSGSTVGFCDYGGKISVDGLMEVTTVRNDSVWALFDITIDLSSVDPSSKIVSIKGYLNGLPI